MKAIISDSLEVSACWKQIYHKYILKDCEFIPSLAMSQGSYFESACIGSTAHGDVITELPLARGKLSVATERINQQVVIFHDMCKKLNINPAENTQHAIQHGDNGFIRRGVLDWYPVTLFGRKVIIDLKMTANLDSTIHPFGWGLDDNCELMVDEDTGIQYYYGTPFTIDSIQADFYKSLVKKVYDEDVEFVYFVFESSKLLRNRIYFAKSNLELTEMRVSAVKSMLTDRIKSKVWEEIPNTLRCKRCSLECQHRII